MNRSRFFRTAWTSLLYIGTVLTFSIPAWVQPREAGAGQPKAEPAAPANAAQSVVEKWFTVELLGQRAGNSVTRITTTAASITTESVMAFSIKRGTTSMDITMETSFIETPDGKPISMKSTQRLGTAPTTREYTFGPDHVDVVSTEGNNSRTSKEPLPKGDWLTPAAADRFGKQRFKSGAKEITVKTIDPSLGTRVVSATRKGFTPVTVNVMGRSVDAIKTTIEQDVMPGVTTSEILDTEGELIRSDTTVGGLAVVMTASTKEEATNTKTPSGKAFQAPELMVSTFVKPDKPISNARNVLAAEYLVSVADGELPALPETGAQNVEVKSPREAIVRVATQLSRPASEKDINDPAFTASSSMLDADNPLIKRLAREALENLPKSADPARKAETLRRFVHRYISGKNLDVGLASATETAKSRKGDCTEHGVLLAALLRAQNIPSRVVSGLIYADQFAGGRDVFAYHMWSQALLTIDGTTRWVDLDATLEGTPFDATHIAFATSPLADGDEMTSMVTVATMLGRVRIDVKSAK